jgi:hypothetical protein
MEKTRTFNNFPISTVILSNLVSILIYTSGLIITLQSGWIFAALYLAFILAFEYRLLSKHCINCYYWGKTCGFGKGRLSSLLFKKGDLSKFCDKTMSWKDMIPDLLISLIPVIMGIVLLIIKFNFLLLSALFLLITLITIGNGFIRGSLTCKFCKQRDLGCPAEKLFSKTNDNK